MNNVILPELVHPRLEKWRIAQGHMIGYVYGHPIYPEGEVIRTSKISFIDGDIAVTQNNRKYRMGEAANAKIAECAVG